VIEDSAEGRGERLVPSCDAAGLCEAYPPRRILELLRGIDAAGGAGIVGTICDSDLTSPLRALADGPPAVIRKDITDATDVFVSAHACPTRVEGHDDLPAFGRECDAEFRRNGARATWHAGCTLPHERAEGASS